MLVTSTKHLTIMNSHFYSFNLNVSLTHIKVMATLLYLSISRKIQQVVLGQWFTCRALVSSCSASSWVGPVMAVHSLQRLEQAVCQQRCQPQFLKCWGTFNAVGEFVTRRNHRVLSVPLHMSSHRSETHTAMFAYTHTQP